MPSLWLCTLGMRLSSWRLYVLGVYWRSQWLCALGVGLSRIRSMLGAYLLRITVILLLLYTYAAASVCAYRAYDRVSSACACWPYGCSCSAWVVEPRVLARCACRDNCRGLFLPSLASRMCGYASVVSAFSIALASICLGNEILPGVLRKFFGRYLYPRVDRSCERGGLLKYVLCAALSLNYMCVTGIEIPWRERALPLLKGFPVAGCVLARIMVGRVLHVLAETMVVLEPEEHAWCVRPVCYCHATLCTGLSCYERSAIFWYCLGRPCSTCTGRINGCVRSIQIGRTRGMLGVYLPCAMTVLPNLYSCCLPMYVLFKNRCIQSFADVGVYAWWEFSAVSRIFISERNLGS